ncbi:MAG: hypothetical protein ACJLS3_07165 [Erythrobacter sp.]
MNLGGRAALSVPLIALTAAGFLALFEVATHPRNAIIKGWDAFNLVFAYTFMLALPTGLALAMPAVLFGKRLPSPRWLWLGLIGFFVGVGLALVLGGAKTFHRRDVFGLALMGMMCGALWWHLVERHREEPIPHD